MDVMDGAIALTGRKSGVKRRNKVLLSGAIAIPVVLGVSASAYGSHYRSRALPGSTVVGMDVAGMTREQVAVALQQKADAVAIDLTLPDGTRSATLKDLGTTVDIETTVNRIFAANDTWISYAEALFGSRSIDVVTTTDRATFEAYLAGLGATYAKPATDAKVTLGKDKTTFEVAPAVAGRALEAPDLALVAQTAATTLTSATAKAALVEQAPAVPTATGQEVASEANALVKATVRIKDGSNSYTPTAQDKASWVQIPADGGAPVVVADRVASWVATATKEANTAPTTGLRYVTSAGANLRVVTPAQDGRKVTNAKAVAASITKALTDGKSANATFKTAKVAATWTERTIAVGAEHLAYPAQPGEKWIDVNLSQHTMTAYVGGTVAHATVKMVDGAPATPTDVGTFRIYLKNPMMTMRGQNADGTDYETPNVPWSSFFNGGEALHGAYWRESYGYSASHGCVNLPIPIAKWIYDWAPIGTPVVTHH